jgi:hypothetical protein
VNPFGSRYSAKAYRPYRGAQLAPAVRTGTRQPVALKLTATRRGLLEAIAAGRVRYVASTGWKCERKTVNALVQDCVRGGWVTATTAMDFQAIALTDAGREAIGLDEVSA